LALGVRQASQDLDRLDLLPLLFLFVCLLGNPCPDQALEAFASGDQGENHELGAHGQDQWERAPGEKGESQGGSETDQVVLALEGVREVVGFFGQAAVLSEPLSYHRFEAGRDSARTRIDPNRP
jgi:hypothetical protein